MLGQTRFNGSTSLVIPAGQEFWSDALEFPLEARSNVVISLFVSGSADLRTGHRFSRVTSYIADGDQADSAQLSNPSSVLAHFFLSDIDVFRPNKTDVVVAIGDSTTQGGLSTVDAFHSYPDQLSDILNETQTPVAVVNSGIGGGRLVKDVFGPCGACRLSRDVLGITGATHMDLLFGINDISWSHVYSGLINDPTQIYSADVFNTTLQQTIDKAKAAGLKVYVGTIFPQNSLVTASYDGQAMRQAMNAFIRNNKTVDGVIDFDALLKDPSNPLMLNPIYNSGDGTHPNDSGYAVMAQAVAKALYPNR